MGNLSPIGDASLGLRPSNFIFVRLRRSHVLERSTRDKTKLLKCPSLGVETVIVFARTLLFGMLIRILGNN